MVVGQILRAATLSDLQRVLPKIDSEFIFGKGRSISVAQRFPAVFCPENVGNLLLTEEHGELLACLACKRFSLLHNNLKRYGVMIGAVYTVPHRRGEKLASRLLDHTVQYFRDVGLDFAVLWTNQPTFYSRLGWHSADGGVLGKFMRPANFAKSGGGIIKTGISTADTAQIEHLREQYCEYYVPRQRENYLQLPLPAQSTRLYISQKGASSAAFALVGADAESGILYEIIGDEYEFPSLWAAICSDYRRIIANDVRGSSSYRWFSGNTSMEWQEKPLAMWFPLSKNTDMAHVAHWYIPYFDRI